MRLIWEEEEGRSSRCSHRRCWVGMGSLDMPEPLGKMGCQAAFFLAGGPLQSASGPWLQEVAFELLLVTKGWFQMWSKWDHWGLAPDASQTLLCGRQIQEHTQEPRKCFICSLVIACPLVESG